MSGTTSPRVSVIVPSYRAGGYLAELCASLVAQTFRDFEVLILSDGGDDHRHPAVQPYLADARFRLVVWEENRGVAAATAALLRMARGSWWCNPGADDVLEPDFLAARIGVVEREPATRVIFGAGRQIDASGAPFDYGPARAVAERLREFDGVVIPPERMLRILLQENVVNTPSVFCDRATIPVLLEADVGWRYAQDLHYWIVLAAAGIGFRYVQRELHRYRIHPRQLSSDPARASTRLAELRLVPLVALSQAAGTSVGAACWRAWRDPLYLLWVPRALSLARRGALRPEWLRGAVAAYHGRECSRVRCWLDLVARLPAALRLRRAERERAARQIFTNGLRLIDDPIFRVPHVRVRPN